MLILFRMHRWITKIKKCVVILYTILIFKLVLLWLGGYVSNKILSNDNARRFESSKITISEGLIEIRGKVLQLPLDGLNYFNKYSRGYSKFLIVQKYCLVNGSFWGVAKNRCV